MCQFEHERKKIKLFPYQPKTEQAEQKPVMTKKPNSIKGFPSRCGERSSFRDPHNQGSYQGVQHSDASEVTLVITEFVDL